MNLDTGDARSVIGSYLNAGYDAFFGTTVLVDVIVDALEFHGAYDKVRFNFLCSF